MKEIKYFKYQNERTKYKVDIHGNVYSYKDKNKPKKLTPILNAYGYLVVNLHIKGKQKQFRVHRMVAMTFLKNPKHLSQVNHIDGDKTNNDITNLEWCTPKANTRHAIRTGLRVQGGEDFHSSKLKDGEVHKICKLLENNELKISEIPAKIGKHCTISMVRNIMYGTSWKHISEQYDLSAHTIERLGPAKFTEKQVRKICKLLEETALSYKEIADKLGYCTKMDVNHIKNKYSWSAISKEYDFSHRNKSNSTVK